MSDATAAPHPIAITGMHRSGTSMITRGLHESGLRLLGGEADALLAAADDNPEGFWENKAIVTCNDDLLEAAGGSWDNPPALLPMAVDDPRLAAVVEPATVALAGLAENERWGFKDPRTCLTAAFWLDLQPDLRFVICVRNPLEVALSLKRRNQNSYSLGLSLWERYYESVLDLVPPDRRIVTHYDTYFLDPVGELDRVCAFAGLEAAPLNVRTDLRHHDVGVSLDEANLGSGLRDLYARLCEEAGAPVPRPSAVDEGQVRRLVLDGTVAARHAEQRQQAIERLEQRLADSQAAEKEAREQLTQARRESESRRAELAAVTRELDHFRADIGNHLSAIEAQTLRLIDNADTVGEAVHRLEDRQRSTLERTNHIGDVLDAVHVKLRAVEQTVQHNNKALRQGPLRRAVGKLVRRMRGTGAPAAAKQTVKAGAAHLPQPVRHNIHRVRRAVADGQAGNRVKERTARVVDRLPEPAQKAARKGSTAIRRSGAVPKAKRVTRGVARRLPAPVKRAVRSVSGSAPAARPNAANAPKKASPAPRPTSRDDGRAAQVPKGPAAFKWQKGFERLVDEFVDPDSSWAVVTPGCKPTVVSVGGRTGVAFPSFDGSAPAADSVSLIAILEVLRLRGTQRLVVPEGARAWFQSHPELRDHLARSHRVLADRDAAGVVFDLTASSVEQPGVLAAVKDLSRGRQSPPALLDWSGLDLAGDLPGFTTFVPASDVGAAGLPYFDRSVEIVVTSRRHDLEEAKRVASSAVVVCDRVGTELRVETVHLVGEPADAAASVTIVATSSTPEIDAAVRVRAEAFGAELRFDTEPGSVDAEVVLVLEAGMVPLPGALDAMTTAVRSTPEAVWVAKVLDDHGRIESAGGMVFADGSVAGIAEGTLDVRAPWHEFNRPTCWGGGIVAASSAVWQALPEFDADDPVAWFGQVWKSGRTVAYRSSATVVRVGGASNRPVAAGGAWPTWLASRPQRPAELGDGSWRYFLANDDIGSLASGNEA
ncbi:MAG: sulfotransferase [Acidimicrobiales bacterium]